jgi:hypothetical protein
MTMKQYTELLESRDWCHRKGFESMKRWYDEELTFQARRRALPIGVQAEYDEQQER